MWDATTRRCTLTMSSHSMAVSDVRWGGEDLIYSASRDCAINVWDAKVRWLSSSLPPSLPLPLSERAWVRACLCQRVHASLWACVSQQDPYVAGTLDRDRLMVLALAVVWQELATAKLFAQFLSSVCEVSIIRTAPIRF